MPGKRKDILETGRPEKESGLHLQQREQPLLILGVFSGNMSEIKVFSSVVYVASSVDAVRTVIVVDDAAGFQALGADSTFAKVVGLSDAQDFDLLKTLASKVSAGSDSASSLEHYFYLGSERKLSKVVIIVLPTACSRHNTPARSHALAAAMKGHKGSDPVKIVVVPKAADRALAQALAVGRQFPLFSLKSSDVKAAAESTQAVSIVIDFPNYEESNENIVKEAATAISNIRLAQKLVDSPPNILHSDAYVEVCRTVATALNVKMHVIQGKDLEAQGFGGIWGVGKAAEHLPALVILSHYPNGEEDTKQSVCLVGKGIIYDTGGLSIKVPPNMAGMKNDMGGSAAVLGAFATSVANGGISRPLHALLCIAENSISSVATRPDDVHTMLSGKTVEINNTDAEGRLVLSDGVFYSSKYLNPLAIIDIATLTGAQLITTGRNHAAIASNSDSLEDIAVAAGKYTGDLTFPILYCPEFYRNEFRSAVADMKNSVADRSNAQSSCAGQFIANHIDEYLNNGGQWLHVDMAGPVNVGDRATGYGVALLHEITKRLQ